MPAATPTETQRDDRTRYDDRVTAPVHSAFKRESRYDNTGSGQPWTENNTYAKLADSQYQGNELTDLLYQQQSFDADLGYRQPKMYYQQPATEQSQGGPTNASTGYPGPLNYPSTPGTSRQQASLGNYESPAVRNDPGGNFTQIDLTPSGSGRRYRARVVDKFVDKVVDKLVEYSEEVCEPLCDGESWTKCMDEIMSCCPGSNGGGNGGGGDCGCCCCGGGGGGGDGGGGDCGNCC